MRIVTQGNGWSVVADWMGAERVVFSGDIFACCRFVADEEDAEVASNRELAA